METTLYERLGGADGIARIANDTIDLHLANPTVKPRFAPHDPSKLKRLAFEFFAMGSGGPETYTGRELLAAHTGMNISEQEFIAVVDDMMAALDKSKVADTEKNDVLAILYSLKGQIIRV